MNRVALASLRGCPPLRTNYKHFDCRLVIGVEVDTLRPVKNIISTLALSIPRRRHAFPISIGACCLLAFPTLTPPALAADAGPGVGLKQIAEGFTSPVILLPLEDGSGRLLIADQTGTVHILDKEGQIEEKLFLDLRDRVAKLNQGFDERGLLGLALHPRFKENRRLFVVYSAPRRDKAPAGWDHTSHVSEFQASPGDATHADPATERVLLEIDEPQFNHNSGRLAFGPDGYLYVSVGDGGNANDEGLGHPPQGNGQDLTTLLGKILRIDVNGKAPYGIPSDNPFVNGKGRPEIFAYGLRNPWGMTFDRGGNRELFVADVGQNAFEEVDIITKGGNYGWRLREGFHGFDPKSPNAAPADAPKVGANGEPLLDPILEYKNFKAHAKDPEARGISITGGYVYRGKALPQLQGRYVFADWSRNWALPDGNLFVASRPSGGDAKKWSMKALKVTSSASGKVGAYIVGFGQDAEGELYVLTTGRNSLSGKTGKVFKLVPQGS